MADPAVLSTAIGTAVTGGLLATAKIIDAVSNFIDARRDRNNGGSNRQRRDVRLARTYEDRADKLRDPYRREDDSGPFEQALVTP